jgi:hypothetical protein
MLTTDVLAVSWASIDLYSAYDDTVVLPFFLGLTAKLTIEYVIAIASPYAHT